MFKCYKSPLKQRAFNVYLSFMMSDNKTAKTEQMFDILTLSEASAYTGVSTRTIERHATFTNYQTEILVRNRRKTKGYTKEWLDKYFNKVRQSTDKHITSSPSAEQKPNEQRIENEAIKETSLIEELKQDITFLRKEIEVKNEQIQAKDTQILELISSEQKTKMLLADLQLQQKNLLIDKPSAKQWEKKSTKIWWALFFLLVAISGVILYYGIHFIQDLINSITR